MTDLSRGNPLPEGKNKTFNDHAEELLANFAGVDRAELLKTVVALAIMDMRYGNKREERAACDLLNLVQAEAVKQLKASAKSANEKSSDASDAFAATLGSHPKL
jgi:hypothetical protein